MFYPVWIYLINKINEWIQRKKPNLTFTKHWIPPILAFMSKLQTEFIEWNKTDNFEEGISLIIGKQTTILLGTIDEILQKQTASQFNIVLLSFWVNKDSPLKLPITS